MICHLKLLFCALCFISALEGAPKLWPEKYPRCYRDDPNLNKCMVQTVNKMKPFLKKGLSEFHIPSISPFYIPQVTIQQGTESAGFTILMKNLTIVGFDTYDFEKFDFDINRYVFDASLKMGLLKLTGNFSITGKLLSIPVDGSGHLKVVFESANGTLNQEFYMTTKKGLDYLDPKFPLIKIDVGKILVNEYSGLYEENEVFSKAIKKTLTDNQEEVIQELKPAIEKVIGEIIMNTQKQSFSQIPFENLFGLKPK